MTEVYEAHTEMINRRHRLQHRTGLREYERADIREIERTLNEDIEAVIEAACEATGVTRKALNSRSRNRPLPDIRHMIFYVAHTRGHQMKRVAQSLGGRDHSTAVYGREKIIALMNTEKEIAETVAAIQERL